MPGRHRRTPLAVVALVLGAAAAACSVLTSLDDLTGIGTSSGDAANEAASDVSAPETSAADAPLDQATQDAATHDASDGAADVFRCDAYPDAAFCDDFDTDPVGTLWAQQIRANGGSLLPTSDASVSPPRSLLTMVPTRTANQTASQAGFVPMATLGATGTLTLAFDVMVSDASAQHNTALTGIVTKLPSDGAVAYYNLVLAYADGVPILREAGPAVGDAGSLYQAVPLNRAPRTNAWSHVVMQVTVGATSSSAQVTIDGTSTLAQLSAHKYQAAPQFSVGINWSDGDAGAFSALVDNVVILPY